VQPASHRFVLSLTTAINPPTTSHAAPTTAKAKENVTKRTEMSSQTKNTPPRSTDGTTLSSSVTMVPKGGINNSATNFSRIPVSPATLTSSGDFSELAKSATTASTSTVTPSNFTFTYSTPSTAARPSDNPSINSTRLFPTTSITLTSPTIRKNSTTPNFNPTQQTTELNHNFSNNSTASSNSKDTNEGKTNKGGVIVGAIVGAIFVSILIGLIGYFICGKKRSESFSHRRLYDDTRSNSGSVLHLDNSLGSYNTSFGCASDDKTSTADKAEEDNAGSPSDGIPMADMTPSHLSL
ncbi:MUC15 protein, partial [Rostratula benghalensis]|nr:MUC15 protein [Rostratula benghalensis]